MNDEGGSEHCRSAFFNASYPPPGSTTSSSSLVYGNNPVARALGLLSLFLE